MQLYKKRVPVIASGIVTALTETNDIEVTAVREVELDVASVLESYVDAEQQLARDARDMVRNRGLPSHQIGKTRRLLAERRGLKIGDEALDYVLDQIVAMLWHSSNVEEVYVEDVELRRKMAPIIRRESELDEQLDQEARGRLKNIKEGSDTWDIEYKRVMDQIKRRKGM